MSNCAVKACKNYARKKLTSEKITFHQFPTDPALAESWINIIRLSKNEPCWKPKKRTCICSAHFCKNDKYQTDGGLTKIRKRAIPTKALFLSPEIPDIENIDIVDDINTTNKSITICMERTASPTSSSADILIEPDLKETTYFSSDSEFDIPVSDISISGYPKESQMRNVIRKKSTIVIKQRRKIKNLQKQNQQLHEENEALRDIIRILKDTTVN